MDAFMQNLDDDLDLDALMVRVREAALGVGTGAAPAPPPLDAGDAAGRDEDLVKVLDAQSEWNEQTQKVLADLVQCLQTLRDDWAESQKGPRGRAARQTRRAGHAVKRGKQRR